LSAQALVQPLIDTLLEEAGLIDELLAAAVEQREMVKSGDRLALQDMMKRVQNISFRVRAQEAQRERLAQTLAEELGCEAHFSAIAGALAAVAVAAAEGASEREAALFRGAGDRLKHSVFALKAEMTILSGLIDQNERFSAMLLSEWRRLDAGFMRSGGLDFKG
jgi:CRISPR/Cas system-associated endoribonuclease Cas2